MRSSARPPATKSRSTPPRDRSFTKSSKSATNKSSVPATEADTPVQFVKGVGPGLGTIFQNRGISTVRDLLHFFPRAYEDRSKLLTVGELREGERATVAVEVQSLRHIPIRKFGRSMLEARTHDGKDMLSLKWFHAPRGLDARLKPGTQIIVSGIVKMYMGTAQIVHPELSFHASASAEPELGSAPESADHGRVVPIYTELEGVSSRVLRKVLWEAVQKFLPLLPEDLPARFLQKHGLPKLAQAIQEIHFPGEKGSEIRELLDFNTPAHRRLIYEEFFKFQYLVLRQRMRMQREAADRIGGAGGLKAAAELEGILPFRLTGDQKRAVEAIFKDFSEPHPMNRLIQGDVGSGKTAVSFITAACVLAEGGQCALMAPTEILAEQHYLTAVKLFGGRLNVALLTGKTPQSERAPLLKRLAAGEPVLLIGTHALIENAVVFRSLRYVMVDEQHRFGVEQRRALREKGVATDEKTGQPLFPHSLILTATPIPRTLALTAYGDLAVTSLKEMPPGRSPIVTKVVRDKAQKARAFEHIRRELKDGHQAYFIYPLVNESEAEGFTQLKSAVAEADALREAFPEFKVGLLHGQLRPEEKAQVMDAFKRRETHILVSTTVVEVGVDVPNATVMVIEHAERFGLSQLHQLRGRVGRGSAQSYCFLFSHQKNAETSQVRLEVLEETTDGFKIAEADLEIRGPGDFLGTRQAGGLAFRMGNLVRDREWLERAREDVLEIMRTDPDLETSENAILRRYYERDGKLQFERLKTS